ncbi:TetR/AcrR family transcriptional regulator [Sphingomonas xinjiangensis]|uniref:AcrR family transcriptional regulator n=1 Tax=Sphingomonas xinjiangensis TaxID=643568 RepID=A0A840YGJ1_9SPHN|nr:TetR/AcrR family transcriptional regulator [Sphingomonas xinjiangensis]MBB5709908.1 AcrR family transcriptional regulator [Sphingomonas xinjiangensis]
MEQNALQPTRAETRRGHLLETARTLFIEHGFHQTGMAQIATASGIKVGQIYRDFHSKEDIIAAICERDVSDWLEEDMLAAAVASGDPGAVREWMGRFLSSDEPVEECRLMSEIVAEVGRNARIAELNRSIDRRIRNSLSAALQAIASAKGSAEDQDSLIDLILSLGMGIMLRRSFDPDLKVDRLYRWVSEIIDQRIGALAA